MLRGAASNAADYRPGAGPPQPHRVRGL